MVERSIRRILKGALLALPIAAISCGCLSLDAEIGSEIRGIWQLSDASYDAVMYISDDLDAVVDESVDGGATWCRRYLSGEMSEPLLIDGTYDFVIRWVDQYATCGVSVGSTTTLHYQLESGTDAFRFAPGDAFQPVRPAEIVHASRCATDPSQWGQGSCGRGSGEPIVDAYGCALYDRRRCFPTR